MMGSWRIVDGPRMARAGNGQFEDEISSKVNQEELGLGLGLGLGAAALQLTRRMPSGTRSIFWETCIIAFMFG